MESGLFRYLCLIRNRIRSVLVGLYVDELASLFAGGEYYDTVDKSEKSVILAHAYIETGMVLCAALTLKDVAGFAF